jgi:hypothetical protein
MNLKLCAIKKENQPLDHIQLVVVDLDKSRHYPLNFVCILPRCFRLLEKRSSKFANLFGEKSFYMAKKLLTEAARREDDPEIKEVIKKRLKALASKVDRKQAKKQLIC